MSNSPALNLHDGRQALAALRAALTNRTLTGRDSSDYLDFLADTETTIRALQATQYDAITVIESTRDDSLGYLRVCDAIADRLRITRTDARGRIATAEILTDRLTAQGQPLAATRENLAKLAHDGTIGTDHIKVAKAFFKDLGRAGGGLGRTGGGLRLPISEVLKIGRHAQHYLAIFNGARPVALYHGRDKRLATAGQRLMLHASEGGCTFESCERGAYLSQVHHAAVDWVNGGLTNIDEETLACDIHHPLVGPNKWVTRKNSEGVTEWIPPKHIDPTQTPRINRYHYPERRIAWRPKD